MLIFMGPYILEIQNEISMNVLKNNIGKDRTGGK